MDYTFGSYLSEKRKALGISLRGMSKKINIAPPYLCDIEKNRRYAPKFEILKKLRGVLYLSDNEFQYLCNLAADSKKEYPADILEKTFSLSQERRFELWNQLR